MLSSEVRRSWQRQAADRDAVANATSANLGADDDGPPLEATQLSCPSAAYRIATGVV